MRWVCADHGPHGPVRAASTNRQRAGGPVYARRVLRLHLVGRVAAEADGTPLPVPSGDRVRALVGWLGLHPGLQSRGRVAAALWPDADEAQARARLRTTVWALRQAWGDAADPALGGARDTLGFAEPLWVDATDDEAEARSRTASCCRGSTTSGPRPSARRTENGRALASGCWPSGPSPTGGRTRRSTGPGGAVWSPGGTSRRTGRWSVPCVADGDRAGAADAAQRFTERLRADLGVAPSPTTRSLHADVASGTAPRAAVSIFGRTAELGLLDAAWRATTRGSGRVVVRHRRARDRQDHACSTSWPAAPRPAARGPPGPPDWTSGAPCRSASGWSWPAGWPHRCRRRRRPPSGRWS